MSKKKQSLKSLLSRPMPAHELTGYWSDEFSEAFIPTKENMHKTHKVPSV